MGFNGRPREWGRILHRPITVYVLGALLSSAALARSRAYLPVTAGPYGNGYIQVVDIETHPFTLGPAIEVGILPFGVAVSPDKTRVYVSNRGSHTVSVIDATRNTLLANVLVGDSPAGVAVSPDGTRVYVSNFGSGSVSVIDASTNVVTQTVMLPDDSAYPAKGPMGVAVEPSGAKVYVIGMSWLYELDASTMTATRQVFVAQGTTYGWSGSVRGVAAGGGMVFVPLAEARKVLAVSAETMSIAAELAVDSSSEPVALALKQDVSRLYVTCTSAWRLYAFDLGEGTPPFTQIWARSDVPAPLGVALGGGMVFVASVASTAPSLRAFNKDGGLEGNIAIPGLAESLGNFILWDPNRPPVAEAGPERIVECAGPAGTSVVLDGSASSDPDGDALTYVWSGPFGLASGSSPSVSLPLGNHTISLTVTDPHGVSATDSVSVKVRDTTPPAIVIALSPSVLSARNHELVGITARVAIGDVCDASPVVTLDSIVSSEPDNGVGDGDTAGDIQGAVLGTDDRSFFLRAERAASGPGRVYSVTYVARDATGNQGTATAKVTVPHDQGNP